MRMSIFFPRRLLIVGQRSTGRFHVTIRSKFTSDNTALERRLVKFSAHWPNMTPEWFESRSWIWLHYAVVKLGRGELFEAIGMLAFFREQVLGPMLYRRANLPQRGVHRMKSTELILAADLHAGNARSRLRQRCYQNGC